ncbi:MAG TPA: protein translocase subunit SecD [Candidatus Magasanikbacteria bacterium]|mgnify:CR=1 FL=1|nr:protein translocase subunit SecD [Candidatus Magasanikbacteria bacterium]
MKRNKTNIRSKLRWGIVGIFVLMIVASFFDFPVYANKGLDFINNNLHLGLPRLPEKNFNLGLDLQGGAQLIYQADTTNIANNEIGTAVEGVRDVIERRINSLGVSEPIVQTNKIGEEYRISVELAGVTDIKEAIAMIGGTPILEFKEINNEPARELTAEEKKEMDNYNKEAKIKANQALQKVKAGTDFASVVAEYSEDMISKNNAGYMGYLSNNTIYPEIYAWASTNAEGSISKTLLETTDGYNILKRGGEQEGEIEVKASHILICYLGSQGCENPIYTKEEARTKAQEIYNQANATNFAQLAKENSSDPGSKDNGGELGWFGKGVMIPEFEKAIFDNTQVGEIVGPVETAFGFHIIYKVDERRSKTYEVSRILINTKTETDIIPPQDIWKNTDLSGKQLEKAEVVSDPQTGAVQVSLSFDNEGKQLFADITERNVGQPVAIFLDGEPISVPTVNDVIRDGRAVISGNFNIKEAQLLSQRLNTGALPVPIELVSQQTVGASLGIQSLQLSLKAGIIGILAIMLFMLLYYRLPGFLSVIALTVYVFTTLALFKLIGVTLTLSGIAGFILSIGMAVDANVLIFERMKEELRAGKTLRVAVEEGFLRAWTSIRDSNLSTLISCVLLMWIGTGFVKGFAVTLSIGILVSMFTAITVSRTMLRFVCAWFSEYGNWLFLGSCKQEKTEVKK